MRHLIGVALAIVMAAAVFFAASWGYLKLLSSPARGSVLPAGGGSLIHDHAVLEGFGALLAVGLLAGLLIAVPRKLFHALLSMPKMVGCGKRKFSTYVLSSARSLHSCAFSCRSSEVQN